MRPGMTDSNQSKQAHEVVNVAQRMHAKRPAIAFMGGHETESALEQLDSILDDACSRAVFGVSLTRRCRTAVS